MVIEDDAKPNDPYEIISEELGRLSESIESGQKTHTLAVRILASTLAIILGSGTYIATRQPRVADQADIQRVIHQNQKLVRPDPWTGTMDRKAMEYNTRERHREQDAIRLYVDNRFKHKSDRLDTLESRIDRIMERKRNGP